MLICRVDYLDDIKYRGYHIEKGIDLEITRFNPKDKLMLTKLAECRLPFPRGHEIVAVIAVKITSKDEPYWRFADDEQREIKAGALYIAETHIAIWLRDESKSASYFLCSLPLRELYELSKCKSEKITDYLKNKITVAIQSQLDQNSGRLSRIIAELETIRREQAIYCELHALLT